MDLPLAEARFPGFDVCFALFSVCLFGFVDSVFRGWLDWCFVGLVFLPEADFCLWLEMLILCVLMVWDFVRCGFDKVWCVFCLFHLFCL